ncbi:MAG TPA: hypothetical protein VF735_11030 [Pyrinomonadaceae bacterium]|jgi:uncharacterized membrane protein (DUF2068 family)
MDMKTRNRLWLISAPVSALYMCAAALAFVEFYHFVKTLKQFGIDEQAQLRLDNVVQVRNGLILAGVMFLLFGLLGFIISYGLFSRRAWAAYSWYALLACFVAFHLYRLITAPRGGTLVLIERGIEVLFALAVVAGTWLLTWVGMERSFDLPPPPPEEFGAHGRGTP